MTAAHVVLIAVCFLLIGAILEHTRGHALEARRRSAWISRERDERTARLLLAHENVLLRLKNEHLVDLSDRLKNELLRSKRRASELQCSLDEYETRDALLEQLKADQMPEPVRPEPELFDNSVPVTHGQDCECCTRHAAPEDSP